MKSANPTPAPTPSRPSPAKPAPSMSHHARPAFQPRSTLMKKALKSLLVISGASPLAFANVIDWKASGGSTTWGNATSWVGNTAPVNDLTTDIARFNQTSYTNQPNAGTTSINGIQIGDGTTATAALTISGTSLTIGSGGITKYAGSGAATISATSTKLGADQSWTNNSSTLLTVGALTNAGNVTAFTLTLNGSGTGGTTLSSVISNGGTTGTTALNINTTGGTTTLSGANTFTGGLTLTQGNLTLGNNASLGGVGNIFTIAGGTVDVNAARTTTNNNAQNWNGNFTFTGSNTWNTGTGAVTLGGTRQVTVSNSTMTVGGAIGDGGSSYGLIKAGAGTLVLSGNNTYTGATTISDGTLSAGTASNLGGAASNIVLDGGTLQITGTTLTNVSGIGHTVITNSGKTVSLDINNSGNTFTFDQVLNQGTAGLTKLGAGTLVLNQTNTYSGATSIGAGSLSATNIGNSGVSSNIGSNGTINFGATTNTGTLVYTGTGETSDKVINLAGTTGGATITQSGTGILKFTSNVTATGSGNKTFTLGGSTAGTGEFSGNIGDVGGTVGVTKTGNGTWTLSGANSYSGLTNINGASGTLITSGTNSSNGSITVNAGTLQFANASNGGIASGLLTISSGASLSTGNSGTVILSNAVSLSTSSGGTTISGNESIVFNGNVTFLGTSGKGLNNTMTNGSTVTLNGDLILANTGANVYTNNAPNSGGAPGTVIINGVVRTGGSATTAGSIGTTKGTLILSNNANSYAGATTVNAGGVLVGTAGHAFGDTTGINVAAATLSLRGDASTNFTTLTSGTLYGITTTDTGASINVDQATVAGTGAKTMAIGAVGTTFTGAAYTVNFTGANNTSLSVGAITGPASTAVATVNIANAIAGGGSATVASYTGANTSGGETLTVSGVGNTTITGAITPSSTALALTKSGTGTLTLSGTSSSFTGATNIQSGTVSAVTLNSVAGGTATSSLGAPSTVSAGTIGLGATTNTGTLKVVGTGETTDRVINLAGTTGGGAIEQAGTGLLKFTSDFTATGAGNKTLTLQGSTAGTGEIAGAIVNNSVTNKTSVTKTGTGTWKLSGSNSYTGATTVSNGTLIVSGSIASSATTVGSGATLALSGSGVAGSVVVNSGTFQLGTAGTAGAVTINDGVFGGVGTVSSLAFTGNSTFGPGNSPGTVTIANGGAFNLSSGTISTFEFTDGAFTPGSYDFVTTAGTASGSIAGTLNLNFSGGGYSAGGNVTIIDLTSISGTFNTVNVTGLSGLTATVGYDTTGGNVYVTLTAVPEPSTYALVAGASLLAVAAVRRKRRANRAV